MKLFNRQKEKLSLAICMMLLAAGLTGCGKEAVEEEAPEISDNMESDESKENTDIEEAADVDKEETEEQEEEELQYIELIEIEDYYGDHSLYELYVPIGNENEDGYAYYFDHGLSYSAMVYGGFDSSTYLELSLKDSVEYDLEEWQNDERYSDIEVSDILKNGSDRYQILTAKKEDFYGTVYDITEVCYMDIREKGVGVLWSMVMEENDADEETELIIDELAKCYDVDLDSLKASGGWALANAERIKQEEDERKAANRLPETILWFNATYAPLTYSNHCDWELVGGMRVSDYNQDLVKRGLSRDWGIEDKASALETVESLIKDGHRAKCRECLEELDEMGLLDVDEETLAQGLVDSGIQNNLFRYVIAYYMHQDGLDADYIAAWDLSRVNQLYADFYICGYMTYEEAMDASLKNSLKLQEMYDSWDDMVSAYMLGYQFWQSDPCLTDDSPTMRRYQCVQTLDLMDDGPYTLDWDMQLEKCW
ncbi:MAG: DUF1266 domain-containing protein [Lachnospiraceae bacterium]|nr:DUF1266 domain-containing protein [Lachnospiraceae bacterium]